MARKILKLLALLSLPLIVIGALYLYQDRLPSQKEVQKSVKNFKPVKEMQESYRESLDVRLNPVDPDRLKGTQDLPSQRKPRSGEWVGPASQDPRSGWKTSKNSGWKGPGAK